MQAGNALTISVIIPVFNGGEKFQWCLEELSRTFPQPDEIIVVSDGDTDNSWLVAERFGMRVVRHSTTRGPAAARNTGAELASGDILFFVDADVLVRPSTIGEVVRYFQLDPDLTALIGSYDDEPSQTNFMSQYRNLFHHYTHQISYADASTFWGACGAIRREVFLELGGFDERYTKPCIEDIEFGYRLKEAGYKIRLCRDLYVKHLKKWRVPSVIKTDVFQRALPWTELLLQRSDRMVNDLNLQTVHRLSAGLLCGALGAMAIALWWLPGFSLSMILFAFLFFLNLPVYKFFYDKKGVLFTIKVIPLHWLYYLYSSFAFALGFIEYKCLPVLNQLLRQSRTKEAQDRAPSKPAPPLNSPSS